jgi:hypothetical protein
VTQIDEYLPRRVAAPPAASKPHVQRVEIELEKQVRDAAVVPQGQFRGPLWLNLNVAGGAVCIYTRRRVDCQEADVTEHPTGGGIDCHKGRIVDVPGWVAERDVDAFFGAASI